MVDRSNRYKMPTRLVPADASISRCWRSCLVAGREAYEHALSDTQRRRRRLVEYQDAFHRARGRANHGVFFQRAGAEHGADAQHARMQRCPAVATIIEYLGLHTFMHDADEGFI